jgi:hypothetical protein
VKFGTIFKNTKGIVMKKYLLVLLLSTLTYASLLPSPIEIPQDQLNILYLQDNKKMAKQTIRKFKKTFRKFATRKISKISVNDVWWSTTFNAYAMKYGPIWRITVHGGLLKHPSMTSDLLSLVLCHELGHFLGAAPKHGTFGKRWSSVEGQADYWTGQKCLYQLFADDDNRTINQRTGVDALAKQSCDDVYKGQSEREICYRISMTGLAMGKLISEITGKPEPALDTPDPNVVDQTYVNHPKFQCRVDTYFQASLCDKSEGLSDEDPYQGTCEERQLGARPKCWFKSEI